MGTLSPRTKVSVTLPETVINEIDELVGSGTYESRSAAFELAVKSLLRKRMDEHIEAEVAKLDRESEIAEAEEGMTDFAHLVSGE